MLEERIKKNIAEFEEKFDVEAEKIDATAQKEMRNILEGAEFERSELANRLVREVLEGKAEEAKGASGNNTVAQTGGTMPVAISLGQFID